jgi:hypothetical protein
MSSRKNTIVTGCTGYVSSQTFDGYHMTKKCSECENDLAECQLFRKTSGFTRIRADCNKSLN